jgi:hypothetical protein
VTSLPLWLRWVLSLLFFVALAGGLLVALHGSDASTQNENAGTLLRANRQARTVVLHDQAPRSRPLARSEAPKRALQVAIAADLRSRVRRGQLAGPVQGARCGAAPSSGATRRAYKCLARAAGFGYPFFAVADLRTKRLTWCKFDASSAALGPIAVSPRCRR